MEKRKSGGGRFHLSFALVTPPPRPKNFRTGVEERVLPLLPVPGGSKENGNKRLGCAKSSSMYWTVLMELTLI